ncbi:MAG: hypothetical protein WCN98_12930 [Verrucomicrobiaceae bacterium]
MNILALIKKKCHGAGRRMAHWLMPSPVNAYGERSMLYTPQRGPSEPNDFLLDLSLRMMERAKAVSLAELTERQRPDAVDFEFANIWPGEHYRLLAALIDVINPQSVVEIGTFQGLSTLAMKKFLRPGSRMATFDIMPWEQFQHACFRPADFADGSLVQKIGDLSNPAVFQEHQALLDESDLIFCDGPKDGVFERRFLENLAAFGSAKPRLLVFDDIRLWKMLDIWRDINHPKLDITSFGHWTGTGLVAWNGGSGRRM